MRCSCSHTDPCPSSLDEIAHLEHVIQLHTTKYSLAIPFAPPPKPTSRAPPPDASTSHANANVLSVLPSAAPSNASYTLPAPPRMPMPLQNRNRPLPIPANNHAAHHGHTHIPSSPTASSIASSTPSSPCKPSSPTKPHEVSPTKYRSILFHMCMSGAQQTKTATSVATPHARSHCEHVSTLRQALHGQCAVTLFCSLLAVSFSEYVWKRDDTDKARAVG